MTLPKNIRTLAIVAGFLLIGPAVEARASLTLRLSYMNPGGSTVSQDFGSAAFTELDPSTGSYALDTSNTAVKNFLANSNLKIYSLAFSSARGPDLASVGLDNVFVANSNPAGLTLGIAVSDDGFTPSRTSEGIFSSTAGMFSTNKGQMSLQTFVNNDNNLFQTTIGTNTYSPGALSYNSPDGGTISSYFNPSKNFSITDVMTISFVNKSTFSGSGSGIVHAPEPGTLAMGAVGILMMAGYAWRKRAVAPARS